MKFFLYLLIIYSSYIQANACESFLTTLNIKNTKMEYVACKTKTSQVIAELTYKTKGINMNDVEKYLISEFGISPLTLSIPYGLWSFDGNLCSTCELKKINNQQTINIIVTPLHENNTTIYENTHYVSKDDWSKIDYFYITFYLYDDI